MQHRPSSRPRRVIASALLILVSGLLVAPAWAASQPLAPALVDTELQGEPEQLAPHMDFWVEEETTAIEEVLSGQRDASFQPYEHYSIGPFGKNLWFRFTLQNTGPLPAQWILNLENALLFDVELLSLDKDGRIKHQQAGMKHASGTQFISHHYFALPIEQPKGSQTYYLRLNTPFYIYFSPTLNSTSAFLKSDAADTSLTFLFVGLLSGIFVYLVVLFSTTRFDVYVVEYAAFTLVALFMILYMNGFLMPLMADSAWLKVHFWVLMHALLEIFYLMVTRRYFLTGEKYPLIHRYLGACIALAALSMVLIPVISFELIVILQLVFIAHLILVLSATSLYIRMIEGPKVSLFVIGNIGLLIAAGAASIEALMSFRFTEWITKHGPAIGFSWQALFFTWALSKQIGQLRVEKNRLEAESKAKSDFIAKMSHEIRTPMNGVLGMTQLLRSTPVSDEQKHYLNVIENSGKTLLAVINDILDYSRLAAGKVELSPHIFNLEELLAELNTLFGEVSHQKNISFNIVLVPGTPVQLYGDSIRLRQVLTNLLSNAFKFTDRGLIVLKAKSLPIDPATEMPLANDEHILHFSIKDSGIGISRDDQKMLFQNFGQIDNTMGRRYGGAGLGLAISKQFVEMMGGTISLHSVPSRGSEFSFTCRLKNPAAAITLGPPSSKTIQTKNRKILVAEDNEINRNVIAGYLQKMGVSADFVENGREAVSKIHGNERHGYSLILMDTEMPVMNGIAACTEIRNGEKTAGKNRLAIVALSAHTSSKHHQACLDAGMNDCLDKPVSYNQLQAIVEKWAGDKT